MPRYFFDTIQDGVATLDSMGLELQTLDAVRDQAVASLPLMALDALPDGDRHEFAVEVRDEQGHKIFRTSLSCRSDWLLET